VEAVKVRRGRQSRFVVFFVYTLLRDECWTVWGTAGDPARRWWRAKKDTLCDVPGVLALATRLL